jgi:GT2 family glycosyltransferase
MTTSATQLAMHPRIGVVVLAYQAEPVMLAETIAALEASDAVRHGLAEILVAENGPVAPNLVHGPATTMVALGANYGFAGGTNRAMAQLSPECEFVFFCNPDAIVLPDTLTLCAHSLAATSASVLSVAPKMILAGHHGVIDAVGNCVNARGEAANIGLGQPDVGQFDTSTYIFGPCFGAGMFRRTAFQTSVVGPLDDRLFLYYEDVDWNWRAQLLGYESITEPKAVVMHQMSSSTRHLAYDFKFHLTERNLMLCALKNFSGRRALHIWVTRSAGLLLGALKGHYPAAGLKAVLGTLRLIPSTLHQRRRIQKLRVRTDAQVTQFARTNRTFFDAVTYQPIDQETATAYAKSLVSTLPISPPRVTP